MKSALINVVALTLCSASTADASNSSILDKDGLFFWLFTGFASMIIAFQFLPGVAMFSIMAKNIFAFGNKFSSVRNSKGSHIQ